MSNRRLAAVLGFLGVALGAFGAHGLDKAVAAERLDQALDWWHTGAVYHLLHAVAILALGDRRAAAPAWCFAAGILVFSGTLYAMALGAPRWFGAVTPFGGLLLLAGWLLLLRRPRD